MTSSLYGHKAASVVTHVSRPKIRPGGDSWSSSRRTSPHPGVEKHTVKTESRKSSFPWSLKKSGSECSLVEHKHGWKPVTLTAPVLFPFAMISLLLFAILEVLANQSQRAGGLALSRTRDEFPAHVTFSYLFLPTIVAVFYSLFWSWVDLDAKRIQPWFEMSKAGGATARNSLLLAYPYEFVATVPFAALGRRHWSAFYGGTVMVIIFWLITPLQTAIFGTGTVSVRRPMVVANDAQFLPASDHAVLLDQAILNEAYAVTWLEQPYPPFTTAEYAIMPFKAQEDLAQESPANITGDSWKYWTQLDCWPAKISRELPETKRTFYFENGRGCNATEISPYPGFDPDLPYRMLYLGWQGSPWVEYSLASPSCSADAQHQFLATWARGNNINVTEYREDEIDVAAIFCETGYWKQEVTVTVASDGMVPFTDSIVPSGQPQRLPESEFNITAFEYLLGSGVSSVESKAQREWPFQFILEQYPKTADLGLKYPMSAMTGFAVGLTDRPALDTFSDTGFLGNAFNATQKLVFSVAFSRLLTNSADVEAAEGFADVQMHGVIVSRLFSAIVEGLLALVAILSLCLWWATFQAPSKLTEDPASLGSLIDICRDSSALLNELTGKGCLSEDDFEAAFSHRKFQLSCGCESRSGAPVIHVIDDEQRDSSRRDSEREDSFNIKSHYTPVKPWALRRDIGVAVIAVMLGVVAALSYLKWLEIFHGGLARPTASFEVLQLLLNYLPTIFATAFEPFWVLVNRLLCMLQPFKDLWGGGRPAKGSINARYTSIPPQMVFWRAAGSGHLLLSAVCSIALLSNLLAVGLGGLFDELPASMDIPFTFEQRLLPRLVNQSIYDFDSMAGNAGMLPYEEHFYVAMNNYSRGTPLPAWISEEYFFQPFLVPERRGLDFATSSEVSSYTAKSRGFGVTPHCRPIGTFQSKSEGPVVNYTVARNGERMTQCPTSFQPTSLALNLRHYTMPAGPSCAEVVDTVTPGMELQVCDTSLILGWSRSTQARDLNGTMDTAFVICEPAFETATFDVTVDLTGRIINSTRTSDLSTTLDYADSMNHTDSMTTVLHHMLRKPASHWHNDTLSRDWVNYLLKIRPGNEHILDPTKPLPDTAALVPHIEAVYRQIYALMLGLNQDIFEQSSDPSFVEGTQAVTETRIFMPLAAFIISISVLGLNILTAVVLYTKGVKFFLPRMPTTIGSLLAYIAPSRAVREFSSHEPSRGPAARTFSFGRYIGDDGRAHLGIELDPYVVPVKLSSLKKGNTMPSSSRLKSLFKRKKTPGDTWL